MKGQNLLGLGVLLVGVTLGVACANDVEESPELETGLPSDFRIELRRTGCFGGCPVYRAELSADCKVRFKGTKFVYATGVHHGEAVPNTAARLAVELAESGFMDLTQEEVDDCPEELTDHSSVYLTVRMNGRENSIRYYYGCRGKDVHTMLERLAARVDVVLQTGQWVTR